MEPNSFQNSLVWGLKWLLIASFLPSFDFSSLMPAPEHLKECLEKEKIIPDVLKTSPIYGIEIWFNHYIDVEYGNYIPIRYTMKKPHIVSWPYEEKNYFVIIMTGLDVPSNKDPRDREWLYWMVGNIEDNDVSTGETWAEYKSHKLYHDPGTHRVLFVVYKQPDGKKIKYKDRILTTKNASIERPNFHTEEFAAKYKLGSPYAGNYFDLFMNETTSKKDKKKAATTPRDEMDAIFGD